MVAKLNGRLLARRSWAARITLLAWLVAVAAFSGCQSSGQSAGDEQSSGGFRLTLSKRDAPVAEATP